MLTTPPLTRSVIALGALFSLATVPLTAQTATSTTPPVGYVRTELLGQSDTFTAASLTRPPIYVGAVESTTGNTITVSGSPNWSAGVLTYAPGNQPNTYYVRIGEAPEGEDNPFEGRDFKVETNGGDTLIVTDPLDGDLSDMPVGTKIEVLPYWTLNTLFPAEDAGVSFEATTGIVRKTEILVPDHSEEGINLAKTDKYYFRNAGWRKSNEDASIDFGDTPIVNPAVFKVRNPSSTTLSLITKGSVCMCAVSQILKTQQSTQQDNRVSTGRPIPVSLNDLGLIESGAFKITTGVVRQDTLLVYSNETIGYNKASSATYFYRDNGWRKSAADLNTDFGDTMISPDSAFIIRKSLSNSAQPSIWTSTLSN